MRREDYFKNTAFGGAWSERIAGVQQRIDALAALKTAIEETPGVDLRESDSMIEALILCTRGIPRGDMFREAWIKALSKPSPASRQQEMHRIYVLIEKALGINIQL